MRISDWSSDVCSSDLRDEANQVDVPTSFLEGGEHYALEVEGDSMIDAGIFDGDTVIVQRCDSAEHGAIVVALIDDVEVTLNRLRRKGHSIALEPANTAFATLIFRPARFKVPVRLLVLLRNFLSRLPFGLSSFSLILFPF